MKKYKLNKIKDYLWEISPQDNMLVPGRIYATEKLLGELRLNDTIQQVMNVATLQGIQKYSLAMPDIHWGYGFPIGGVAAFDINEGIISPGGVGYDINCGVRLLKTQLVKDQVVNKLKKIIVEIFRNVPSGVGSTGRLKLENRELKKVLFNGAHWAVENGYGFQEDLEHIEETGRMEGADPELVSNRALQRGSAQLGTLGSGNHFVEVQFVDEVYDEKVAKRLGLFKDQVTLTIHTGSRGFGHQVCDDSIKVMLRAAEKYHINLPDRQLCCAPIQSPEGQRYLAAMTCAVNFAFANRQLITHWARESFRRALSMSKQTINMQPVYEVAHNIAKIETHKIDGIEKKVCVHRKGATRAFGAGQPDVPAVFRDVGQPVLIPGDMGRYSYVLIGTEQAMEQTFGTTCHGAGRVMSRIKAKKNARGRQLVEEMANRGVLVMASSQATIAEEMPEAYKDVADVIDTVDRAGISKKVARLRPLGVVKG